MTLHGLGRSENFRVNPRAQGLPLIPPLPLGVGEGVTLRTRIRVSSFHKGNFKLTTGGENFTVIGRPLLERDLVTIFATVIEKTKTAKVIVFKKKRRKGYKRTRGGENFTVIGRPLLERDLVTIFATVIEKTKTAKVIVFKKKRRKGYKRTRGHRQDITVLRINSILLNPSHLSTAAV
ncbi:predicted protein [Nematostella vectensis]|uniref:Large ribosomal subunit protein bL21m n=1 Tax=Nematostella vectensis TaxID=45351 RepID=A7T4P2_NEMVE|nr:predicted protein [Nematostella vectensis]|eukprot:XP_001621169.1 hypothetical protein NEMVEDRAFT_v1g222294 [Nematostella vectensis]